MLPEEIRGSKKLKPLMVLFMGRRGAGKSVCMTAHAWIQHRRYQWERARLLAHHLTRIKSSLTFQDAFKVAYTLVWKSYDNLTPIELEFWDTANRLYPDRVVSNYWIDFVQDQPPLYSPRIEDVIAQKRADEDANARGEQVQSESMEPIPCCHQFMIDVLRENFTQPFVARHLLLLDEFQSALSNRNSLSGMNRDVAQHLTQIRKQRVEIIYTTQFPQVMDKTVLYQTDLFIICESANDGESVTCYPVDYWGQFNGNNWVKPWPPRKEDCDLPPYQVYTKPMWNRYDTEEMQVPIWFKNRRKLIEMRRANRHYAEKDTAASAAEAMQLPAVDRTLDGLLVSMPNNADLMDFWQAAIRLKLAVPEWRTRAHVASWLEARGVMIDKTKNGWFLQKEKA